MTTYRDLVPTIHIEAKHEDKEKRGTISKLADVNFLLQEQKYTAQQAEEIAIFRLARWEACLPTYDLRIKWRNKPMMQYLPSGWKPQEVSIPASTPKPKKEALTLADL